MIRIADHKVSPRPDLVLRQLHGLPCGIFLVETLHELRDRRLQCGRIVHFENQLPPRRRQHRPVERHGNFATQRRRDVVQHIHARLRFEIGEVLAELSVAAPNHLEHFFHDASRILDHRRRHHAGIGRNEIQRSHRRRRGQPRSNSLPL